MKPTMCEKHKKLYHQLGYLDWFTWATEQEKAGFRQKQCETCGYFFYPQEF